MKKRTARVYFKKGFTLIELLVVFSVISVLTTVSLIGFSNYNDVQQMSQASTNIALLVNSARSNAQSVVKTINNQSGSPQACGTDRLESYNVEYIDSTSLKMVMVCKNLSGVKTSRDIRTYKIPTSINLSMSCTSVEFSSLTADVSIFPVSAFCDFTLTRGPTVKTVRVDDSGNVKVN